MPVYVEIYQRKNSTTVTHGSTFIERNNCETPDRKKRIMVAEF